ncbi:MAG: PAS domain S-box protein, partial [Deltaproteobacteria bacterium]
LEENLRTHQVELEMQNAELLRKQEELNIARARYFDLYDLAPVGYCTVSEDEFILEANLTVATLLGLPRGALIKKRFSKFILQEDHDIYYLNRKQLMATGEPQACELRIVKKAGPAFWGHLVMTTTKDAEGKPVCRVVLSDISELKQTNELFSLFMRHSPVYTYFKEVTSTQSLILQASDNFAQMTGIPSTEMIGKTMTELFSPEFAAKITAEDWAVVSGREVLRLEEELNGRIFDTIKFPIVRGDKTLLAGYTVDITERKRAEEAIRQGRERAERLAVETAIIAEIGRVAGSTLDINQVFERVDAEARKLLPYDRLLVNLKKNDNEFIVAYASGVDNTGRKSGDVYQSNGTTTRIVMATRKGILVQPDTAEEIKDLYPNLYETFKPGLRSTMSVPLISMGEVIGSLTFRSKKLAAYTERDLRLAERIGMQIAGAIANAQMFNDLSKTEKTLRESEEKYRILFEGLNDAVFVHDLDEEGLTGHFLQVNDVACRRMGYTREELLSLTPRDITAPEEYERIADKRIGLDFRGGILVETIHVTKDGLKIPVESNIRKFLYLGRQVALSISRDITDRKRANDEQRSLEERLQRAEKMEALGQLAGGVAHDLNNVLGILSGYSELLLEEIPEESRSRGHVQKILQSTQKGAAIIQDLLTLARRGVTASEVLNLNSIVSDFLGTPVFDKFKNYYPRVTFRTECDNNLLNIKGSPIHLEKTVMNLVSNAAEAITETGEVTIRTENRHLDKPIQGYGEVREGDYAVLTVSDTGMGIPAESIGKIFEPFYTKKKMGRSGTGLGLAIVWGTAKDHNGYIDVKTEVGKGTTFTLYFPVTRDELTSPEAEVPIEQYMGNGESVLVVDDIAEQGEIATKLLTRLGYEVHLVSSGEEAVEYLKGNKVDILVLDMIMTPGIDGLDTYRRILEINPRQKAIIVSGFSETERVGEAQKLGAGAYVKKPYVLEKIGVAIRDELNRK